MSEEDTKMERGICISPASRDIDAPGLMFYNARFYDPTIGRFVQADSIVPGGVQGYDRYAYVSNSPIGNTDPTGHRKCDEDGYDCPDSTPLIRYYSRKFQMLQYDEYGGTYNQSTEESNTDFPGSGSSKFVPQPRGVVPSEIDASAPAMAPGIAVDFAKGWQYPAQKRFSTYSQTISLGYQTTYEGVPQNDAEKIVGLASVGLRNDGDSALGVVSYSVLIRGSSNRIALNISAGPGETTVVPLSNGPRIYANLAGLDISVRAETFCMGPCLRPSNSLNYYGTLNFNFNP